MAKSKPFTKKKFKLTKKDKKQLNKAVKRVDKLRKKTHADQLEHLAEVSNLMASMEEAKYHADDLVIHVWSVVVEYQHPVTGDIIRHGLMIQVEGPVLGFEMEAAIFETREYLKTTRGAALYPGASIVSMSCAGFVDNVLPGKDEACPESNE